MPGEAVAGQQVGEAQAAVQPPGRGVRVLRRQQGRALPAALGQPEHQAPADAAAVEVRVDVHFRDLERVGEPRVGERPPRPGGERGGDDVVPPLAVRAAEAVAERDDLPAPARGAGAAGGVSRDGERAEAVIGHVPLHNRAPSRQLGRVAPHRRQVYRGERVKLRHEGGPAEFLQQREARHGRQRMPGRAPRPRPAGSSRPGGHPFCRTHAVTSNASAIDWTVERISVRMKAGTPGEVALAGRRAPPRAGCGGAPRPATKAVPGHPAGADDRRSRREYSCYEHGRPGRP